jgi:hypothetical protein
MNVLQIGGEENGANAKSLRPASHGSGELLTWWCKMLGEPKSRRYSKI